MNVGEVEFNILLVELLVYPTVVSEVIYHVYLAVPLSDVAVDVTWIIYLDLELWTWWNSMYPHNAAAVVTKSYKSYSLTGRGRSAVFDDGARISYSCVIA